MTVSISLLCDNPDGTQKQWYAQVDTAQNRVVLTYGSVGGRLRQTIVPSSRFKQPSAQLEALARADKKRRAGYYDNPGSGTAPSASNPNTARSSKPKPPKRKSVLAALDGDSGREWFY